MTLVVWPSAGQMSSQPGEATAGEVPLGQVRCPRIFMKPIFFLKYHTRDFTLMITK